MGLFGEKKGRSNERKRTNLKKQKWVWSGNPGGTSVTVSLEEKGGTTPKWTPLPLTPRYPWGQLENAYFLSDADKCLRGRGHLQEFIQNWSIKSLSITTQTHGRQDGIPLKYDVFWYQYLPYAGQKLQDFWKQNMTQCKIKHSYMHRSCCSYWMEESALRFISFNHAWFFSNGLKSMLEEIQQQNLE